MKNFMAMYGDDLLITAGCGCLAYGGFLISPIVGWIVAGVLLIGLGWLVGMASLPGKRGEP